MSAGQKADAANEQRISPLEQTYGAFYDRTVEAAIFDQSGAGQLMIELNQICTIVAGLGQVLRIVSGNCVLKDEFVAADPETPPPLSPATEGMLTSMAAAVCEMMRDSIHARSASYNARVSA
jgi:hypothetical protein